MVKMIAMAGIVALGLAGPVAAAPRQVTLSIPTMDCDTCPVTIRIALMKVPGVTRAAVSYERRTAKVTFNDAETTVSTLTQATEAAGYPSFEADDER